MNNLLKLIKMNYYSVLSMGKYLALMLIMGIGFSFYGEMFTFFGPALLILVLNYSALAYEDKSKLNNLICVLPVKPKEYILSKYIYGFLNTFLVLIISNIVAFILKNIGVYNQIEFSILNITIITIGILVVAIIVPLAIILGFEKGRYILTFAAVIPVCFSAAFAKQIQNIQTNISDNIIKMMIVLIMLTLTLLSYFITSNLYAKKDIE